MSRTAVVTGAATGVGRSIADHLARADHAIAVLDLDGDAAAVAAEELAARGHRSVACEVDVTDRAAVEAAYERVRADFGPIEIVVTNAAVSSFVGFRDLTFDEWQRTLDVNLTGTFHCVQAAIGDMVAGQWGRIVTLSSVAGQTASPRQAHYSASKGGVIAMTKTIAAEFAAVGITANTVPPFAVDTPALRRAQMDGDLPPTEVVERMIPAGRIGTGDDIGATCAFLCSDAAAYITGQVIAPNGGARI
jgi:NAD(P)-dependent dehydrogenase (short-subunit alcohol dehydrogenase family)